MQNVEKRRPASYFDMYPEFWTHIYKLGGHHDASLYFTGGIHFLYNRKLHFLLYKSLQAENLNERYYFFQIKFLAKIFRYFRDSTRLENIA